MLNLFVLVLSVSRQGLVVWLVPFAQTSRLFNWVRLAWDGGEGGHFKRGEFMRLFVWGPCFVAGLDILGFEASPQSETVRIPTDGLLVRSLSHYSSFSPGLDSLIKCILCLFCVVALRCCGSEP